MCRQTIHRTLRVPSARTQQYHPTSELYYAKEFIKSDVTSTICQFAATFSVAVRYAQGETWAAWLPRVVLLLIIWVPYALSFTVPGQIYNVAEDVINKPDRLMVRAVLTRVEALRRWAGYIAVYLLASHSCGCATKALAWVLAAVLHNCTPILATRFGYVWKNVLMGLGYYVLQTTTWSIAGVPQNGAVLSAVLLTCVVLVATVQMQDLRDTEGDRFMGRRTASVVFGDVPARRVTACLLAVSAAVWLHCMVDVPTWGATVVRTLYTVHSAVLCVATFVGGWERRVYTAYCLWFMHMLVSLHFTDLSGNSSTVVLQGKIDAVSVLFMVSAIAYMKFTKHARQFAHGVPKNFNWMTLLES